MLVLTRRVGESVIIDGETIVTVEFVAGGQVRLSFEAPQDVVIDRMEVHNAKQGL